MNNRKCAADNGEFDAKERMNFEQKSALDSDNLSRLREYGQSANNDQQLAQINEIASKVQRWVKY